MDGITRKRMQCDSHIAKIGYFGWKKVWRGTGEGRRSMYTVFMLHRLNSAFSAEFSLTIWQIFGNDAMAAIRQPATILLGWACISTGYVSARGDGV